MKRFLVVFIPLLLVFVFVSNLSKKMKEAQYKPTTVETEKQSESEKAQIDWGAEEHKVIVYLLVEGTIKESLNDPESAKFPTYQEKLSHTVYLGDNVYQINSYFRAKNGFGGLIKKGFSVQVFYNKESYRYSDFKLL